MQDMPINYVIGTPESSTTVKADAAGTIEVRGYAMPKGADGPVVKVNVSSYGGKTWTESELAGKGLSSHEFGGRG
jgi:sulfite oxidase